MEATSTCVRLPKIAQVAAFFVRDGERLIVACFESRGRLLEVEFLTSTATSESMRMN